MMHKSYFNVAKFNFCCRAVGKAIEGGRSRTLFNCIVKHLSWKASWMLQSAIFSVFVSYFCYYSWFTNILTMKHWKIEPWLPVTFRTDKFSAWKFSLTFQCILFKEVFLYLSAVIRKNFYAMPCKKDTRIQTITEKECDLCSLMWTKQRIILFI